MKIGIIINIEKDQVIAILPDFLEWLTEKNFDFCVNAEAKALIGSRASSKTRFLEKAAMVKESDVFVSFGGDGTLLSTARLIGPTQKPILGVNVGKLGFLTEIETMDLHNAMERVKTEWYKTEDRLVLECSWNGKTIHAMNDIVVMRGDAGRVIPIGVKVGTDFLNNYIADGLIIATPTGSTAYSLSANGPILSPTLDAIIVNPICPHTLTMRPLVINSDRMLTVTIKGSERAILTADGTVEGELNESSEITVKQAGFRVKLIRFGERTFFDVLRSKLHWGEDGRASH